MIFKFLCLQKPLLKSQEFGTCYAGRGLRSGTPRWGYPSHRYRGGPLPFTEPRAATPLRRPLPTSHVQMMNYFRDWPRQYGIDQNKKMPHDTAANYDVSRKRDYTCGTSQHESCETFMSYGQKPFDFRPSWQRQSCITY